EDGGCAARGDARGAAPRGAPGRRGAGGEAPRDRKFAVAATRLDPGHAPGDGETDVHGLRLDQGPAASWKRSRRGEPTVVAAPDVGLGGERGADRVVDDRAACFAPPGWPRL